MDAAAIAFRFGLYLDLMALFGIASFGLYALRAEERASGAGIALRPLLTGTAVLGALLSAASLAALAASMADVPLSGVTFDSVRLIVAETSVGSAWLTRMVVLAIAVVLALLASFRSSWSLAVLAAAAAIALATLAWGGHGAMDSTFELSADIVHLLAAGLWVGALLALVLLAFPRPGRLSVDHLRLTHRALAGFSSLGTVVVALIVITGVINTWLLVGPANFRLLPTALYGQLLILKLLLFALMLGLASTNRFRLVPALERALEAGDHANALRGMQYSLALETGCAVLILALVAWLGTLEPVGS